MEHSEIKGLDIRYREYGHSDGPVVFLLHGFGGGPLDYKEVIPYLEKDFRVIVPNLKVFFTNQEALTYTQQVDILREFVDDKLKTAEESFHLVGVSYGATLSLGLRTLVGLRVTSHTIVNPMPFSPLEKLRNPFLKIMLNFYYIPGGLTVFLKTPIGERTLQALGKVFHMSLIGKKHLKYFNERKLNLIEKALKRFMWVAHNENWVYWYKNTRGRLSCLALYCTKDSLFSADDYESFIEHLGRCRVRPISGEGHRLVVTHPEVVGKAIFKNMTKKENSAKAKLHTA